MRELSTKAVYEPGDGGYSNYAGGGYSYPLAVDKGSLEDVALALELPARRPPVSAGGGGGAVVIQEIVVGTPTNTVTFSDIPQTFKNLKLLVTGGNTGGPNDPLIILAINGDNTSGNYATNYLGSNNAANFVGPGSLGGFAGAVIGNFNGAGDSSRIILQLPHYAEPNYIKMGTVDAMTTGWGFRTAGWNFKWASTAPVTSLELKATNAFETGTIFTLIGE